MLFQRRTRNEELTPYLIGIAGPSGAGKSYLAEHVAHELGGAAMFRLDSYYHDLGHLSLVQRAHQNFDSPISLDSALLTENLRDLSKGKSIEKPLYDFTVHSRKKETERVDPQAYIIVEGLFALYWEEIRKFQGTKVYVDLRDATCLERRIDRDIRERGRTRESVLEQYSTTVLPMAKQFVYPSRAYADIVVCGDDDIDHEVSLVVEHIRKNAVIRN